MSSRNEPLHLIVMHISILFIVCSCSSPKKNQLNKPDNQQRKIVESCPDHIQRNKKNNLNLSILLDLSDRIEKPKILKKDSAYLSSLAEAFINHVKTKKLILLDDKIQLFFNPEPSSNEVNEIAEKLKIHITKSTKKEELDKTLSIYSSQPKRLYSLAQKDADNNGDYEGSDIWRFFKDNVKDYCIDNCHRNVLVIITDGYMYHKNTIMEDSQRTSYLTPQSLSKLGLSKGDWSLTIKKKDLGFIPATKSLDDLEVLVIGIASENAENPYALDIIEFYWSKWLLEMGVNKDKFKLKNAEIASNIDKVIIDFLKN